VSSGLDHLWAGWRSAYIAQATAEAANRDAGPQPCVLCSLIAPGHDDRESRVVWRGALVVALLNAYPYTSGHLMVLPARHVGELEGLEPAESAELWDGVQRAVVAIKAAYQPGGVNLGANLGRAAGAGIPGHLHLHALPRWDGDTSFITSVAEARVLPEPLDVTWEKLRRAWPT
jgi:ATP adenylyltransferase